MTISSHYEAYWGLNIRLVYWAFLGVWNSLSQEVLDDHRRSTPNQGVRRSVQNGIILPPKTLVPLYSQREAFLLY
jgi:hypothetical protein